MLALRNIGQDFDIKLPTESSYVIQSLKYFIAHCYVILFKLCKNVVVRWDVVRVVMQA